MTHSFSVLQYHSINSFFPFSQCFLICQSIHSSLSISFFLSVIPFILLFLSFRLWSKCSGCSSMGNDESKSPGGSSASGSVSSAVVDFPNAWRSSEVRAWTLLHQCTLDKWTEGHAGDLVILYAFYFHIFGHQ